MTDSYISSKVIGPVVTKVHVEPPGAEGTKNYANVSGHMTNIPTLPIYAKIL